MQPSLYDIPGSLIYGFHSQYVSHYPVGTCRHLSHEVGIAAGCHGRGSRGEDIHISHHSTRSSTLIRALDTILGDGCTEGYISVHGSRCGHHHIGTSLMFGTQLGDIIDGA